MGATRARALATALVGTAAVVGFSWFTIVTEGFAAPDESWFLQVVSRVRAGETLYRDVYFNSTPLSIYLTVGLTYLFPAELLLVRSVVAGALVATVALCWLVCRRVGAGRAAPWLLVSAWAQPAPYTPVAMAFFAAAFFATVVWMRRTQETRAASAPLWCAAVCAGLCFGAKQNLGVYCLGALVVSVLIVSAPPLAARRLGTALAGFAAGVAPLLAPVYVTGAIEAFAARALDKSVYLEVGRVSYGAALERFRGALAGAHNLDSFGAAYREFAFLLPAAAAVLLLAACLRARGLQRQTALVVTTFVAAGYLVVYPRPGGSSNIFAIPILLVGLAYGWQAARPAGGSRWHSLAAVAVTVLLFTQIGLRLARHSTALVSSDYVTSDIPHFRGMRVLEAEHARMRAEAGLLATLADDRRVFLIGPHTGFYYLAAGLTNPDPVDFPYASVFGRTGQDAVISSLRSDRIGAVFVFSSPMGAQTPAALRDFVSTWMVPVRRESFGVLYRSATRVKANGAPGQAAQVGEPLPRAARTPRTNPGICKDARGKPTPCAG